MKALEVTSLRGSGDVLVILGDFAHQEILESCRFFKILELEVLVNLKNVKQVTKDISPISPIDTVDESNPAPPGM